MLHVYSMDDKFASYGGRILVANQKPTESVPFEHDVVEPATVCTANSRIKESGTEQLVKGYDA